MTTTTTAQPTRSDVSPRADAQAAALPPRLSLSRERLHFVTYRRATSAQGPRMRLTGGLVGRR